MNPKRVKQTNIGQMVCNMQDIVKTANRRKCLVVVKSTNGHIYIDRREFIVDLRSVQMVIPAAFVCGWPVRYASMFAFFEYIPTPSGYARSN